MPIEARAEHFSHDADIGVRGTGLTRESAFEQAAIALAAIIVDVAIIRQELKLHIECDAPRDDLLLVDWLNALIYHMAVDHLLLGRFYVAIEGHRLSAEAWGEKIARARHVLAIEVYRERLILCGCGDFINDYVGIGGYEAFRDDLGVMCLAGCSASSGRLIELKMVPFQIRKFRLNYASREDVVWLRDTLDRESTKFGTRIALQEDHSLHAIW